jgi:hypothetical protein
MNLARLVEGEMNILSNTRDFARAVYMDWR